MRKSPVQVQFSSSCISADGDSSTTETCRAPQNSTARSTNFPVGAMMPQRSSGRSVVDFESEAQLLEALNAVKLTDVPGFGNADWMLPTPDPEAEPQLADNECRRLLALKSYLALDAEKEEAFDKLTEEACRFYDVPTSLISLVDLGRQFLLSNTGNPGDVRETPRNTAFCAYTILNKKGICIVKDTMEDDRFRESTLVKHPPHLRFYAGAPLISPEGYKLGTFCVEGPVPRPQGLTPQEQRKLEEFASRTMNLLVQRRNALLKMLNSDVSVISPRGDQLRRHAAIATNLGGILYQRGECVTAMRLYQESVQTLMQVEEHAYSNGFPPSGRQEEMSQMLQMFISDDVSEASKEVLTEKVVSMYQTNSEICNGSGSVNTEAVCHTCVVDGIPGLFSFRSNLKGLSNNKYNVGLVFAEPFKVDLDEEKTGIRPKPVDFIIPLAECSKATLFNMGLIHYHWGCPDTALQFFDLAASLSHAHTALCFDPVVLGCLNNMAQIHLEYGKANDAMEMLSDALTRGNAALAALYTDDRPDLRPEQDRRSCRLRRKLARTVLNMGHVHFFNCDYTASTASCHDAFRLLHSNTESTEAAAVWYNIALLHHHQDDRMEALTKLENFLKIARRLPGNNGPQIAEGLHRKGLIMFEMGNLYDCMRPLNEALRIRRLTLGLNHATVAETLCLIGKILQEREEYDFALNSLKQGLEVQRSHSSPEGLSFEAAQTLLEIGRAYKAQGQLSKSLEVYVEVCGVMRDFFGERHVFVARVKNIIANLHLEAGNTSEAVKLFSEAMRIHVEEGIPIDFCLVQNRLARVDIARHPVAAAA